mmetsp:Transcript_23691/g.64303  ORF Transcript_23691/g.64303 Transcript_23691/m.64303 type:complete len:81 (-) Transcript_23691:297-539(-)|eukprot:CAMPEP_0185160610 /NCGR_PEP_ID=MMETSP1139-20130426/3739_1 /TAXON_ID=298111 /ORGANISM="Pavlova sp., Strain CCMP459" /LENGTH=80 /DNA_ID=CAMNT_0027725819 /DNA_START=243 /DNA_END=485 /DNA_ORIENTATION=-
MGAVMDADALVPLVRRVVEGDDELCFVLTQDLPCGCLFCTGPGADKQVRQMTRRSMLQNPSRFDWAIESFPKIFAASVHE